MPTNLTTAIYVRAFKTNRWPSFRVSERTERGGFRNTVEFSNGRDAQAYAAAQARTMRVPVVQAAHQCA